MSENDDLDWEKYKKLVVPGKQDKLFEKSLENPRIIDNKESNKVIRTQEFLSSLNNKNYSINIVSKKVQKHFKSEAKIDLHYLHGNLDDLLEKFFSKCILHEIHYITVITGKGKGILKQSVILWLQRNTQFVSEYFEIKDSRKECGSLGIHLRLLSKIKTKFK